MDFLDEASHIRGKLIETRRHFHMYPELSGKEFKTAQYITQYLENLGLEVKTEVGHPLPGVIGLLRGKKPGPTVALRADMDALAINEQGNAIYQSQNHGVMHACGHDAHITILLGAAELLTKHKNSLQGNVKFIFQPSEEKNGGAVPMIKDGALDDVEAIFGLHMDPENRTGDVAVCYGETMAASDRLTIKIKGKSTHGAIPQLGIDPIVIASHCVVALQSMMTRERDPLAAAVLSFGIIQGGTQPNAIADEVVLQGILRTFNPQVREELIKTIEKVVDGITQSFNASYELIRIKSYDSLINDNKMVAFLEETAKSLIGAVHVKQLAFPRMIVEDFAYYLQKVPGAYYFLGCNNPEKGIEEPLHNSRFDIDEDSLLIGAGIQATVAFQYLNKVIV